MVFWCSKIFSNVIVISSKHINLPLDFQQLPTKIWRAQLKLFIIKHLDARQPWLDNVPYRPYMASQTYLTFFSDLLKASMISLKNLENWMNSSHRKFPVNCIVNVLYLPQTRYQRNWRGIYSPAWSSKYDKRRYRDYAQWGFTHRWCKEHCRWEGSW